MAQAAAHRNDRAVCSPARPQRKPVATPPKPRDERVMIPGKAPSPRPVPLRPLRQAPAPPSSNPVPKGKPTDQEDQKPRSPEIVDLDFFLKYPIGDSYGDRSTDTRRLTDHSENTLDIIQYYLGAKSPNTPSSTPHAVVEFVSPEPCVAAFDFGFCRSDASSPKQATVTRPRAEGNNVSKPPEKVLPPTPTSPNVIRQSTKGSPLSNHRKTYSLFPTIQPVRTPEDVLRSSVDITSATPIKPRKASLPTTIRSRADSTTSSRAIPLVEPVTPITSSGARLPRRPITARLRSSTVTTNITTSSTSSPSSASTITPVHRGSVTASSTRWSEDTALAGASRYPFAPPLASPITSTRSASFSTWDGSTARSSTEPLFRRPDDPSSTTEDVRLGSFFDDSDDDGDESVPLRLKWKRNRKGRTRGKSLLRTSSETGKESASWSPGSSFSSMGMQADDSDRNSGGKGEKGWKSVLCGCC